MKYLTILFFLFFSFCIYAQTKIDTSIVYPIDEAFVTATKKAISRNQIPLTISQISEDEITQSSESALLPVLSEQVPGLFVTQRGVTGFGVATGAAGQITMRGIGGSPTTQVLVLLNGNPQFMGIMGHPLPDSYRASDIQKVEIIRGPASTLYGSQAMGGVINIITHEQNNEGISAQAGVSYGSFNTQKYMGSGGYSSEKLNVYAGINYDRTDGHRDASYFNVTSSYFKVGYNVIKHVSLSADLSLSQFNTADPGKSFDTTDVVIAGDTLDILRGMGSIAVKNHYNKTDGSFQFYYNFGRHDITSGFYSHDYNFGLITYQSINLIESNTLTFGFDYKKYGGNAENRKFDRQLVDTAFYEAAGYAFMQQRLFGKLTVQGGIRLDYSVNNKTEWVPTAGISYTSSTKTVIKASISKGYRNPSLRELFLFGTANSQLNPEAAINTEVCLNQYLMDNKIMLEITGYYLEASNLIQLISGGTGMKYLNSGSIYNKGIEFLSSYKISERINLQANYSYINMKTPVLATPTHKLFISSRYLYKKIGINVNWQYIKDLYTEVGNANTTKTFGLVDSRISYKPANSLDFYFRVENLLDKQYVINEGYPMPGRLFFIGCTYKLGRN